MISLHALNLHKEEYINERNTLYKYCKESSNFIYLDRWECIRKLIGSEKEIAIINNILMSHVDKDVADNLKHLNEMLSIYFNSNDFYCYEIANTPYFESDEKIIERLNIISSKLEYEYFPFLYNKFPKDKDIFKYYYEDVFASFYYEIIDDQIVFYEPSYEYPTTSDLLCHCYGAIMNTSIEA